MPSIPQQEKQDRIHTSRVLRSARKLRNLTQIEAAKELQISQSMLSKLEAGTLSPSASLWFLATKVYNIGVTDSFETGFIETYNDPTIDSKISESFRMPETNTSSVYLTVRGLIPLINFVFETMGKLKAKKLFKDLKIDPDLFVILDAKLNLASISKIVGAISDKVLLSDKALTKFSEEFSKPVNHGSIRHKYDSANSSKELLKAFIKNSAEYGNLFSFEVKDLSKNKTIVSTSIDSSMINSFPERTSDFLHQYKSGFITGLLKYKNMTGVVSLEQSFQKNQDVSECFYKIEFAQ